MRLTFTEILLAPFVLLAVLAWIFVVFPLCYWLGWAIDTLAYGWRTW